MVRNKRDVIFKPAVTSITSVVARCLPFPKHSRVQFYLSFSTSTTEGDGKNSNRERKILRRFLQFVVEKHVYKKENLEDTRKPSFVLNTREMFHYSWKYIRRKRRLLLVTIKSKNFFETSSA